MAKDREGFAPLHLAVKANEHEIVQVLLGALGGAVGVYMYIYTQHHVFLEMFNKCW